MMVNETAHQYGPHHQQSWQRTVPEQMPWMSSSPITAPGVMQFGVPDSANLLHDGGTPAIGNFTPNPNTNWTQPNISDLQNNNPTYVIPMPLSTPTSPLATVQSPQPIVSNNLIGSPPLGEVTAPQPSPTSSNITLPFSNLSHESILTYMPNQITSPIKSEVSPKSKRTSMEMCEDESEIGPPSKQWLSENVMLRQFDSLNLSAQNSNSSSDDDDEILSDGTLDAVDDPDKLDINNDRLDRYVYLIFRDKNRLHRRNYVGDVALDTMARNEMDRMHKAVVLWNPNPLPRPDSPKVDEDDDAEFTDGPKNVFKCDKNGEPSLIITEVFDAVMQSDDGIVSEPFSPMQSSGDFEIDDLTTMIC